MKVRYFLRTSDDSNNDEQFRLNVKLHDESKTIAAIVGCMMSIHPYELPISPICFPLCKGAGELQPIVVVVVA